MTISTAKHVALTLKYGDLSSECYIKGYSAGCNNTPVAVAPFVGGKMQGICQGCLNAHSFINVQYFDEEKTDR